MNDFSNKELRALAIRSGRGAYMPWGLAEEAGAAVAWLERHGVASVSSYISLLRAFAGLDPATLRPTIASGTRSGEVAMPACPIMTGAYLSDTAGVGLSSETQFIPSVMVPRLLLPFLVWVAQDLSHNISISWPRTTVLVGPEGFELLDGTDGLLTETAQNVEIALSDDAASPNQIRCARTQLTGDQRVLLEGFVEKTYLPESEHSRVSGAGGGSVDDD